MWCMWRKRNYHFNPKECPQTIQYDPHEIQHPTISFFIIKWKSKMISIYMQYSGVLDYDDDDNHYDYYMLQEFEVLFWIAWKFLFWSLSNIWFSRRRDYFKFFEFRPKWLLYRHYLLSSSRHCFVCNTLLTGCCWISFLVILIRISYYHK